MSTTRSRHPVVGRGGPLRGRARLLLALGCGALLLTGCGANPGAAVTVDGTALSQDALESRTSAVLAAVSAAQSSAGQSSAPATAGGSTTPSVSGADPATGTPATSTTAQSVLDASRAAMNRIQLTDVIRHALVQRAIGAGAATVSDAQVATVLQKNPAALLATQLQVPESDVAATVRDVLVLDQLLKKVPAAGTQVPDVQIGVEGLSAADRDAGVAGRARLLGSPAQIDAALAAAGTQALAPTTLSLLKRPELVSTGLFDTAVGEVVLIPQGSPQFQYVVLRVLSRTFKPGTLTTSQLSGKSTSTVIALGSMLLARYGAGLDVRVNPRYGLWDPLTLQVVPGNSGL